VKITETIPGYFGLIPKNPMDGYGWSHANGPGWSHSQKVLPLDWIWALDESHVSLMKQGIRASLPRPGVRGK
jgi:hypothetical protein